MSSTAYRWVLVAVAGIGGAFLGIAVRGAGEWVFALLAFSAIVVALAQQTLP